jgi:hypothetical protein
MQLSERVRRSILLSKAVALVGTGKIKCGAVNKPREEGMGA